MYSEHELVGDKCTENPIYSVPQEMLFQVF